jgi:hypothetical protein
MVQRLPAPRLSRDLRPAYTAAMFGGMGGVGGRNSSLRVLRLGALAAFVIGTAVFHGRGSGYVTLRVIYIVLIFGVLMASFATRHRARGSGLYGVLAAVGLGAGSEAGHSERRLDHPPVVPRTLTPNRTGSGPYSVR